ncbi:P-loop NTPase fold protein [Maribellus maritimus]|uniref:P-loop NTPase fold protein n=1 Tax=Maribellus maritimus TaxID=2870838 RepID=UPI001EEBDBA7|nr:P-loop NTPase fold protein [Maribellus maritimus]MCG6188746.1 KAP family NTPase [Maribellus maritimus]
MQDKTLTIPIDKIKDDFQTFLAPEHNRRIIFSGPFGIGKTYFLNEFFNGNNKYYPIFLRPINYSLLTNEDIFKLIKYDILIQLIQDKNFSIEEEFDFSKTDYLKHFLSENRFLILRNLLKAIPKIRNVVSVADELEKLFSKYQEGISEINNNPELELLKEFQGESENYFLLEYDEVSDYISSKLDELAEPEKEGESKLKKVLIIDDLDRLDPEHIFRLFNIFSAHFDQVHYYENSDKNDNKFGFDKIIFVCDIENIRKIFAHKYGSEVDFSGYIDKFYSTEIFFLKHKNTFDRSIKPLFENKYSFFWDRNNEINIDSLLKLTLELLYIGNNLSTREVDRLIQYIPRFVSENNVINYVPIFLTKLGAKENSILKSYKLLIVIKILENVLGGSTEELYNRFKKAYLNYTVNYQSHLFYQYNQVIPDILLFLTTEDHKFSLELLEDGKPPQRSYKTIEGKEIFYSLYGGYYNQHYDEGEMWFKIKIKENGELKTTNGEFFKMLVDAISVIISSGILER